MPNSTQLQLYHMDWKYGECDHILHILRKPRATENHL